LAVTFEIRDESAGIGQADYSTKFGIGDSVGRPSDILEDDYGIAVQPERFTDIVSGVDPSKFAGGSGRIGDEVLKRGFGYGVADAASGSGKSKLHANKKKALSGLRIVSEDEDLDDGDEDFDEQEMEILDLSEGTGIIRGRNGRPPVKISTIHRQIEVLAEISYIPGLEGRVDARAARQSVRALQPREVIVLGGTKNEITEDVNDEDEDKIPSLTDEVTLLADVAKSFATGTRQILTPSDGDVAELEIGHAAYTVRLIDTPYESKEEKEREDYEPPHPIEPFEMKLGACNVSLLDCVATGQKVALDGSIVLAPRKPLIPESGTSADIDKFYPPIYISDGEVLLTDLRAELIAQGMKAEYSAHTGYSQLVVNGKIVVRKDHDQEIGDIGSISIEGPLCEDFYIVRSVVYGQYVVL
jgi:cleavage and polyadenylation specificity factor subunit 2